MVARQAGVRHCRLIVLHRVQPAVQENIQQVEQNAETVLQIRIRLQEVRNATVSQENI